MALEEDLSAAHKQTRLRWCREHRATDFNEWRFSDESAFELANLSIPRRQFVHRKASERHAACCIQAGGVRNRQKLMVWGCISSTGSACFEILQGNINAHRYIDMLSNVLLPYLDSLPLATLQNVRFQQDNAPPHRAHITSQFLQDQAIIAPQWPPLSPDLNLIEQVWALMKKDVRRSKPRSLHDLEAAIRASWTRVVTPALCTRLYSSMRARIEQVIAQKGSR